MNLVVFYKNLDTLNLIIFWGIIIVIILLIIFIILVLSKKKKKITVIEKEIIEEIPVKNLNDNDNEYIQEQKEIVEQMPIKYLNANDSLITQEVIYKEKNIDSKKYDNKFIEEKNDVSKEINEEPIILPEEKFVAEEYIQNTESKEINTENVRKPYQKNILKEMSLSQTSPIGITNNNYNREQEKISDLYKSLNNQEESSIPLDEKKSEEKEIVKTIPKEENIITKNIEEEENITIKKNSENKIDKPISPNIDYWKSKKETNEEYLEEVSEKLSNAVNKEDIIRTEYEIQQEENAIISYEELMRKKDNIEIIDEEEAVISIGELMEKKEAEEKLYKITKDEENDNFINELKHFRNDL